VVADGWEAAVASPDVDAVDICTPNRLHHDVAVAAARAGKHVLVEKPMACTVSDADAMIAAAETAGVVLMPAHNVRFAKPFWAARLAVADGLVGDVVGVRSAFGHGGPKGWAPDSTWFFEPAESGGGALIDLGIHAADALRSVLADEVTDVGALIFGEPGQNELAGQLLLRFAGGAVGSLHASWAARPGPDHQLTIFGTDGTLHLDSATPLTFRPASGEPRKVDLPDRPPDLFAEFVAACTGGPVPSVTATDARQALAIICGAYESARTGRLVHLTPRT
jgi:predicted dehydrogenase